MTTWFALLSWGDVPSLMRQQSPPLQRYMQSAQSFVLLVLSTNRRFQQGCAALAAQPILASAWQLLVDII
jgi:hypothetical protein